MTCQHALSVIDAGPFVAHSREQRAALQAHLRECDRCARALEGMDSLTNRFQAIPSPGPSRDLTQNVMARIARLPVKAPQVKARQAKATRAAEVQAPPARVPEVPALMPAPGSRWLPAGGALAAAAATLLITASVATSSDSLMPSVAGFRMGLFAMPESGDELLAGAMGTMLYAFGLFACERLVGRGGALPGSPGDAEDRTGSS